MEEVQRTNESIGASCYHLPAETVQAEKELGSKESIRSPWRVQGMHVRTTEVSMQMREDSGQDKL
jgi:hypothetical protein